MAGVWTGTETGSHVSELTRDREIWGMALWVEKQHGENGWLHIAQQQDRLLEAGDFEGIKLWRKVRERFEQLQIPHMQNYAQVVRFSDQ